MKIPSDANSDVQQAFREVWERLDNLETRDLDMKGRRVMNTATAVDARDYVNKLQLTDEIRAALGNIKHGLPITDPVAGWSLYVERGALFFRGAGGTITVIAMA